MDRRTLLAHGGAALAATVALAGCTGDGGGDGTTTTTDGGTETTTERGTTTTDDGMETTTTEDGMETTTTDGTATTAETTDATTTEGETTTEATTTEGAQSSVEVAVGAGGNLRFAPESFTLQAGGTVTWTWESGGHNVRPDGQPDGADWSGTEGGDGTTYGSGHTYEHTFETPGEYSYYCNPHQSFGMTGSFTVVE